MPQEDRSSLRGCLCTRAPKKKITIVTPRIESGEGLPTDYCSSACKRPSLRRARSLFFPHPRDMEMAYVPHAPCPANTVRLDYRFCIIRLSTNVTPASYHYANLRRGRASNDASAGLTRGNQSRWSATLQIRSSPSPALQMHHQALKMKDGSRIKAIPKCRASNGGHGGVCLSRAETERLRRRHRRRRRR
ncbi:hypothetical protein DBV15_00620 [Temnothorax longispinosus]|uniref:Uncharacterized protein n=1 Tax=Temnothorax longispinosus TaxID=300112 RepID=A0A4S2KY05_9HYME|nr:hypothetical protein DBV15_00620 [Temnothorax longispinosus]